MSLRATVSVLFFAVFGYLPFSANATGPAPDALEMLPDGIVLPIGANFLCLQVRADNIIRVAFSPQRSFFSRSSLDVLPASAPVSNWSVKQSDSAVTLATGQLQARVNLTTGAVSFHDLSGRPLLAEQPGARSLEPAVVQGENTTHVQQVWLPNDDESLYGLGQQQLGIVDIKGFDLDLWQHNTNVVVPFLVSSRGYGVLWDNPSYTRFGDLRLFSPIPADCLIDASGQPGGLTTGTFTTASPDSLQNPTVSANISLAFGSRGGRRPRNARWVGQIVAPSTGDYQFQTYSNGGIKVWIDNQLVIDHWRQAWLTDHDQVKIHLEAGHHYPIKVESGGEQTTTMSLLWKTPSPSTATSLWSEVGDGVDYYFIYGPQLDRVIAGYRLLTGQATMLPQWAFGLWQSRQRYETAQESFDVVAGFRLRQIPFDNIVQDWLYWPQDAWGSHEFDPPRFPDPVAWIKAIHDLHAHLMISVWGKFYPGTANFDAMQKGGFLYQPTLDENIHDWVGRGGYNYTFYDAFNPGARALFWQQLDTALFSKGIDAWWMDATEPDVVQPSPPTLEKQKHFIGATALGPASRVLNAYALENSRAVYEGQRATAPNQRVFILTRSGFAGQQRYAAVTWSGDTTSTWTALAKQIPAGLGFSISGLPYWTMDIGGYTMQSKFAAAHPTPENAAEWRELNVRWFQFGTFSPLLRVHGELQPREMWTLGGETSPAYLAELKFDRLRYLLLPYLYSIAGAVTQDGYTLMRPLVMNFPHDPFARAITNQYMFGPAFLVAPVTTYQARSRPVYLPAGASWYDFWTGLELPGGQTVDTPAPFDQMPLYVRAGSIIPFGPELQYTGQKPADPITLRVYTGANGQFNLYEDDGLTYDYEKGAFARIPIRWNDAALTLAIGARQGSFPAMLTSCTFNIVLVSPHHPVGFSFAPPLMATVAYHGEPISVSFASSPPKPPMIHK
jgi:alpha-D-xyloside xylohydrolase